MMTPSIIAILFLTVCTGYQQNSGYSKATIKEVWGPATLRPSKFEKYECIAYGNPVPSATWRFKDQSIQNVFANFRTSYETRGNKLVSKLQLLSNKEGGDVGDLKCLVKNSYGHDQKSLRLRIIGAQRGAKIKAITGPATLAASKMEKYECVAQGNPVPSATWRFKGQSIRSYFDSFRISFHTRGNKMVSKLQLLSNKGPDEGDLKCFVSNSFGRDTKTLRLRIQGTQRSNKAKIEMIKGPQILAASKMETYECIAYGNPVPSATWRFKDQSIRSNFDSYRISYVTWGDKLTSTLKVLSHRGPDVGDLKCLVQNNFGHDQKTLRIRIKGKDIKMGVAKIKNLHGPGKLKTSRWGRYECVANGVPRPTSRWFFNGQRIQDSFPYFRISYETRGNTLISKLQLMSKTPVKEGDLKCSVHNSMGTDAKIKRLAIGDIRTNAAKIQKLDGPGKLSTSQWGRYECYAKGLPAPSSTWSFNGHRIQDAFAYFRTSYRTHGNTLISILDVMSNTYIAEGDLKCSVHNSFGTDTKIKRVSIGDAQQDAPSSDSRMSAAKIQKLDGPGNLRTSQWGRYKCVAHGITQRPSSTWYFDGQRIQDTFQNFHVSYDIRGNTLTSRLQLMSPSRVQTGDLKCSVSNSYGSDAKIKRLSIGG